jgi:hypothetical protein
MFADARCSLDRVFLLVVIPLCGQIAPRLRHLQQARLITGIGGLGRKRDALLGVLEIILDRRHAPQPQNLPFVIRTTNISSANSVLAYPS